MYTMIMQNLASKREWIVNRLRDTGENWMSYLFEDFQMPDDAPYGEYSCILFWNERRDCTYDIANDIDETVIHTKDGDVQVKQLKCERFLLVYGDVASELVFNEENKDFYYYEH